MNVDVKQENRGGAREGAGRKSGKIGSLSAHSVANMLRKARRAKRKYGQDVDDVLLAFVYNVEVKPTERLAAIKLWKEYTAPKLTEGGSADKELGPAVFLPDQHPRLKVVGSTKAA